MQRYTVALLLVMLVYQHTQHLYVIIISYIPVTSSTQPAAGVAYVLRNLSHTGEAD
jgi:hypothetical protein